MSDEINAESGFVGDYLVRGEPLVQWQPRGRRIGARLGGGVAAVAMAGVALAIGALAIGALAIGTLAIGRLAIGRARLKTLEIDTLIIRRIESP